jgi:hypothetical protein
MNTVREAAVRIMPPATEVAHLCVLHLSKEVAV